MYFPTRKFSAQLKTYIWKFSAQLKTYSYSVVSGCPKLNANKHAGEIASMALELLSHMFFFRVRHPPDHQLRIGIHTSNLDYDRRHLLNYSVTWPHGQNHRTPDRKFKDWTFVETIVLSSRARNFSLTVPIFIQGPVIQRADNVIEQIHCYTAKIYRIEIFPADDIFRPLNKLNGYRNISW